MIEFTIRREIRAKSEDGNLRVKRIICLRECVALCTLESIGDTLESNLTIVAIGMGLYDLGKF